MPQTDKVPYEVAMRGLDVGVLTVEDFANFLRDIVFLHDRLCILTSHQFAEYDLAAGFFYTRYGGDLIVYT